MSHLVIVDGHAVIHRAYHSIPPLTRNGQPVNALYGFYSMLLSAIDTLNPSHLIVCLDSPGPVSRSQEFIGYRAKRKPTENNLVVQLPLLPETLKTAHIPSLAIGGFEADDLIATVTARSQKRKRPVAKVTIITGDKDLMQLVSDKINLFVPVRGLSETKIFGPAEVEEKLGVSPSQVVDLKALMGDMSDNYPGVTGIGPKTAVGLLEKFGSLDEIYSNLTNLSDQVHFKLTKDRDNAYLSQKLAKLINNIPLKFKLKSCRLNENIYSGLQTLFTDYGFKSLASRLTKKVSAKTQLKVQSNQTSLF
jgi:DNA polymerase-1